MDKETISRERLAWLAGVIDSEGSLEVGWTNQYNPDKSKVNPKMMYCRIKVGNTDPRMISEISKVYKEISVGFNFRTTKRFDRVHWMIEIKTQGKKNCKKVLQNIYPHLKNKIDQADKFLEIIQYRESVGYGGFRAVYSEDYKPLESDEKLQRLIRELKEIKHNPPDPQRLRRVANQILVID